MSLISSINLVGLIIDDTYRWSAVWADTYNGDTDPTDTHWIQPVGFYITL